MTDNTIRYVLSLCTNVKIPCDAKGSIPTKTSFWLALDVFATGSFVTQELKREGSDQRGPSFWKLQAPPILEERDARLEG